MDVFILAMQMDEEGVFSFFCTVCNVSGWGHDRFYDNGCECVKNERLLQR